MPRGGAGLGLLARRRGTRSRSRRRCGRSASIHPDGILITIGEPGEGLSGWRFSHRQAKAALPIAERGGRDLVRYSEVALLASVLRDDLAIASFRRLYLAPLEGRRDGENLRAALRAYFQAGRNVSSAAAALGVNRRTLSKRLQAAERVLGRPLESLAADLEVALSLDELGPPAGS